MRRAENNEKYRCPDRRCGAEVLVLRGSSDPAAGSAPTCGCGAVLLRGWMRPAWIPSGARAMTLRPR